MIIQANLRPRIKPNVVTRVKRVIKGQGVITASVGLEVLQNDILGRGEMSAGFFSVKLADRLKVGKSQALKYLQKPIGSKIFAGELLALKKTVFGQSVVTAQSDGIIESYDPKRGELRLKYIPKLTPLVAGVNGIIDAIDGSTGEVLIRTLATEISGIFGSGAERCGTLSIINGGQGLIDKQQITPQMSQRILIGGLVFADTLHLAAAHEVYGILTGGLSFRDFKAMAGTLDQNRWVGTDSGLSVMSTEGFGSIPIGQDILSAVRPYDGKFVFLDGNLKRLLLPSEDPDSIMSVRKVVLPNQRGWELASQEVRSVDLKIGMVVRIIFPPFAGHQGRVIGIDQTPTTIESGVRTYLVTVETAARKLKVPYPNVEVISL